MQNKIPTSLVTPSDLDLIENEESHLEQERENARVFVEKLKEEMKCLNKARGTIEIDQKLQEFASRFCHGKIIRYSLLPLFASFGVWDLFF